MMLWEERAGIRAGASDWGHALATEEKAPGCGLGHPPRVSSEFPEATRASLLPSPRPGRRREKAARKQPPLTKHPLEGSALWQVLACLLQKIPHLLRD